MPPFAPRATTDGLRPPSSASGVPAVVASLVGGAGLPTTGRAAPGVPRILMLIDGMSAITAGGTERQLLQLAGVARQAGLAPTIAVLRDTEWLTPAMAGCPVAAFSLRSLRTVAGCREFLRLAAWMRRERFAVVQTFFNDANLFGPLAAALARVPVIFTTRRSLNPEGKRLPWATRLLRRLSSRCVDLVLTNAEAVSANVARTEGLPPAKLRCIYNGIDLPALRMDSEAGGALVRKALHLQPEHLLVGNISGLRAVKRLDVFVEAAALAHAEAPQLRFALVGEGERRAALEAQIRTLGLEGVVTLAGAQEDVRPWLAAMDIGVLCSEAEGFSNSLLEYMAAGLPIVATEVGGNREALGEAGLLVPARETEALAAAILLLCDPQLRARLGALARARVERFSLREAEAAMGALYRSWCPGLRKPGALDSAAALGTGNGS